MLKWLAILAVFLAVTQTPAPVLGQASNGGAPTAKNPKQRADGTQKPPEPASPSTQPQKGDSPALKRDSDTKKPNDTNQPIAIPEGVTVRIAKDGTDWGVVANLVLAIVGIGGIVVAICTLLNIERQTKATEKQVEHLIASERARMIPRITQPDEQEFEAASAMKDGWIFPIEVTFTNYGSTPALATWALMEITSEKIVRETSETAPTLILDLTVPPKYKRDPNRYAPGAYYVPKDITPSYEGVSKELIVTEMPAWDLGQKCLCVKGYIEYTDTFGQSYISRYCYAYQMVSKIRALQNRLSGKPVRIREFRKCGPDTYNEIT